MGDEKRPVRQPDFRLEVMDDELLLYHPERTTIMYCNQTASLVWNLCDGERTAGELIDLLSAAFPEASERIPTDVQDVLTEFARHEAIEYV